jgi:HD-like signal output (HDOD) protein
MTTAVVSDEPRAKAKLTIDRISSGLDNHLIPVVGQVVRIIKDISGRADRMSVNDLAETISSEPTTMGRIISIAGSVGYNSTGAEIKSVHHAISLIGFDRVRSLAISILLFEHSQSDRTTRANRELAGGAFVSGLIAAEMGQRVMLIDPELAFICGALRGYGRILAATFLPKEYAESLEPGWQDRPDESFKSVFGVAPLELGRQVMARLQLPKFILNSFVTLPASARKRSASNATVSLIAAADFGWRTAELLQHPGLTCDNFDIRLEEMSREYDPAFLVSREGARELLHRIVAVLDAFRFRANSYVGSVVLFRRLEQLASEQRLAPQPETVFRPVISAAVARPRTAAEEGTIGEFEI